MTTSREYTRAALRKQARTRRLRTALLRTAALGIAALGLASVGSTLSQWEVGVTVETSSFQVGYLTISCPDAVEIVIRDGAIDGDLRDTYARPGDFVFVTTTVIPAMAGDNLLARLTLTPGDWLGDPDPIFQVVENDSIATAPIGPTATAPLTHTLVLQVRDTVTAADEGALFIGGAAAAAAQYHPTPVWSVEAICLGAEVEVRAGNPPGPVNNVAATCPSGYSSPIQVSWDAVTADPPVTEYRIYRRVNSANEVDWNHVGTVPAPGTSFDSASVQGGSRAEFRVVAVNSVDSSTPAPTTVQAYCTMPMACPAPPTLTTSPLLGDVQASWTATPASPYAPADRLVRYEWRCRADDGVWGDWQNASLDLATTVGRCGVAADDWRVVTTEVRAVFAPWTPGGVTPTPLECPATSSTAIVGAPLGNVHYDYSFPTGWPPFPLIRFNPPPTSTELVGCTNPQYVLRWSLDGITQESSVTRPVADSHPNFGFQDFPTMLRPCGQTIYWSANITCADDPLAPWTPWTPHTFTWSEHSNTLTRGCTPTGTNNPAPITGVQVVYRPSAGFVLEWDQNYSLWTWPGLAHPVAFGPMWGTNALPGGSLGPGDGTVSYWPAVDGPWYQIQVSHDRGANGHVQWSYALGGWYGRTWSSGDAPEHNINALPRVCGTHVSFRVGVSRHPWHWDTLVGAPNYWWGATGNTWSEWITHYWEPPHCVSGASAEIPLGPSAPDELSVPPEEYLPSEYEVPGPSIPETSEAASSDGVAPDSEEPLGPPVPNIAELGDAPGTGEVFGPPVPEMPDPETPPAIEPDAVEVLGPPIPDLPDSDYGPDAVLPDEDDDEVETEPDA
ncbi:MAG: hypothetical protein FWD83_07145 [Promicromonosporaceae bacterium]|nr:hypothetical protein [Promicromonosporaceae bacterium]